MPGGLDPAGLDPATELLDRVDADTRALAALAGFTDPRLALVAAGWLAGFRSARTRRAYGADLAAFAAWCAPRGLDVLSARRVQVDLHTTGLLDAGAAASSVARRLSALSSFYRFAAAHDLRADNPVVGVRRPAVDPDHTRTVGLTRDEARALVAAADADPGPQRARSAALVRLLLHNALRVDELVTADVADLGTRPGRSIDSTGGPGGRSSHRVLGIVRKGGRGATVALAPATVEVLEAYLGARASAAGVDRVKLAGPLLATRTGGRLTQKAVWELVRRLARAGGIDTWAELSPHSLRHTAITLALDAGAAIRDVQDFAGHRDPRTTRRYDHTRDSLERSAAYTVAGWLA
ncbi:tyrosine-type recombinase/integrase [Actinomycetospora soli]|uniref:tyrosine-type recombinase/integrase n=1 Tax=Actinomycetospora soli TaxID=2893887 RepID=UPI001E4A9439|nr:tyrosine-type recombinase/integrase [Actinomycetospora soli]MCD2191359.1 tyrosine-type recombinase/integrase [Actinomycetospora soli]